MLIFVSFCSFILAKQNTSQMMFGDSFDKISLFVNEPVMIIWGDKNIVPNEKQKDIADKGTVVLRAFLPAPVNAVVFVVERAVITVKDYL